MKKILTLFGTALLAADIFAGVGATTNWVQRYVAEYVANAISNSVGEITARTTSVESNDTVTVVSGTESVPIVMTLTIPDVPAFSATQCTAQAVSAGITNGTLWAWSGSTTNYVNKNLSPIVPTQTNLTFGTMMSFNDNGVIWFGNGSTKVFAVDGTMITTTKAREVRGY